MHSYITACYIFPVISTIKRNETQQQQNIVLSILVLFFIFSAFLYNTIEMTDSLK